MGEANFSFQRGGGGWGGSFEGWRLLFPALLRLQLPLFPPASLCPLGLHSKAAPISTGPLLPSLFFSSLRPLALLWKPRKPKSTIHWCFKFSRKGCMCCQGADLAAYQTVEATILFEVAHIRATFLMQNFRPQGCQALTGKWPLASSLCLRTEWVHGAKSEAGAPLCPWTLRGASAQALLHISSHTAGPLRSETVSLLCQFIRTFNKYKCLRVPHTHNGAGNSVVAQTECGSSHLSNEHMNKHLTIKLSTHALGL